MKLQFRLRTLLIVVAVLAAACGYFAKEAESVRLRRSFIESHPEYRYSSFFFRQTPSWVRGLLGDESFNVVALPMGATKEQRDLASTVFPEAKILAISRGVIVSHRNPNVLPIEFAPFPDETR